MSESTENRASNAFEKPGKGEVVLTLDQSARMLPLVRHIAEDILQSQRQLDQLQLQENRLQRHRRNLGWAERSRRYQLQEEITVLDHHLEESVGELETLGLVLLEPAAGRIGFPTAVNGWRAFFSWHPGEPGLNHWHFAGETNLRPIPAGWMKTHVPTGRGG